MDAARLAQIEQAVEIFEREGLKIRFARELLNEVKRLQRSEGGEEPHRLLAGPPRTVHCRSIDDIRIVEPGCRALTISAGRILEMWDGQKRGPATFDYDQGVPISPPLPLTE